MRRRVSFQGLLLGTLLAVSLGALSLASAMSFGLHRRVVGNLSDALVQQSLQRVTDRLDELVRTAVHHAELYPRLAPDGELTAEDFHRLFEQLWATVEPHEELSYLGVGIAETGEYAMVRNVSGHPLEVRMYVRDREGPQVRDYKPSDQGLELLRTLPWTRDPDPRNSYNLRLRPFYQQAVKARQSVWTDSYEFWNGTDRSQVPGVTFATPVYDRDGRLKLVWNLDLELKSLSKFLARVQGLILGHLLIVEHRTDGTWNVIARPEFDPAAPPPSSESDRAIAAFLQRLPAEFAQAAAASDRPELISVGGRTWRVTYAPLQGPDRPDWVVAALNPLDAELPLAPFSSAGFLIAFCLVGLLATACAWGVSRAIAAPLLTLERDARRLVDGEAETIAPLGGTDEIGRLAATLNELTQKIQQRQAEIRQLNADLECRVAERTMQLSRALKELESFSYSVAHDLRSPLRSISGFSQALQEDCGDKLDDAGVDHLNRIRAATLRMSDLIDALLTLARVSRQELTHEPVDLSELAEQAAARCRQQEPDRRVEITIAPHLVVQGDRALLRIVINNLVDNAWKYTRPTPSARIEFGVQDGPHGREFFVRDNGVGFDPQYAANLFQPFQRLHRTDEFDGHGVGLATVQRILDKHGGHVRLEGRVGEGATCYFTVGTSSTVISG